MVQDGCGDAIELLNTSVMTINQPQLQFHDFPSSTFYLLPSLIPSTTAVQYDGSYQTNSPCSRAYKQPNLAETSSSGDSQTSSTTVAVAVDRGVK